jgi:AcrR family transcriptional regulator
MPRAEREEQMLDVAMSTFAANGFHAASMDDIAERVGVSKPMLYAYFGSKEGLYEATLRRAGSLLLERLLSAGGRMEDPGAQLRAGIAAFFAFVDDFRAEWSVLYREATGEAVVAQRVAQIRERIVAMTAAVITEVMRASGRRRRDAEPLAVAVVGAGESLANWWLRHPDEPRDRMADRLMDVVWLGLERATGPRPRA